MAKKEKEINPKWEQNLDLKKGALHKALGIPDNKLIPLSKLQSLKSRLHKKAQKGKLTPAELTLLRRVNLAIKFKTQ